MATRPPSGWRSSTATILTTTILVSGWVSACFFFFQAEDGIRDHCVTGVQTCALPISLVEPLVEGQVHLRLGLAERVATEERRPLLALDDRRDVDACLPGTACGQPQVEDRSEERRVGKECRYRWSATH